MRPFLRRSGNVARLSQRNIEASLRNATNTRRPPPFTSCLYEARITRAYSSVPPSDPKNNDNKNAGKDELAKDETSSKATENSAEHDSATSSKATEEDGTLKSESQEAKDKDGVLPGNLPLTAEEKQIIDSLLETGRMRLQKDKMEDVERVLSRVEKNGIPPDVREILSHYRDRKLDIMSAVKLIRHASQMVHTAAKEVAKEEATVNSKETPRPGPQQKGGAHNPGPQDPKDGKGGKEGGGFKLDATTAISALLATWLTFNLLSPGENSRDITWQEFRNTFLEKGLVDKITVVNGNRAKVHLHRESVASVYPDSPARHANFHYYFTIGSVDAFEHKLDAAQSELGINPTDRIPVAYEDQISWTATILSFGPTLLLLGALVFFSRRASSGGGQSGIFGMMRSKAKRFNHETEIKVKFSDVAGMDEAKQEIMEFVSFLKQPEIYQKLGAKIPRGAILSGPPGTGKTLLAKATAGESGVPFFSVSGSEFVEMFVGVGASRVRDLFATARKSTPCIIFIDEIDAVGRSRSGKQNMGGNDERESTLNQILTEMDGFNTSEQVVVMAGTNRLDVLDKALLRPGRFDRHIAIDKPTMDGRKQIFDVHLKKVVTKADVEHLKGRLAALTPGFSGADIANCVNEAALIAARNKAASVEETHFEQAIERVIGGLERKSLVLSPEEKRTVAYHEAGHAICGWYFKYADPLLKVSIIPRGQGALGYAQYLPANGDTYLMNAHQLMDRMAMTLGGRVSEELHFETVTSGASDDFKKVTQMATAMVTRFGMSRKIGYLSYDDDGQQQFQKPFSEETAKNIDSEVKRLVEDAYKQCHDMLTEKKKEVGIVAEELLKKEMLTRDDLVRLLGPRPFEEKGEFSRYFGGARAPGSSLPGPPGAPDPPADGPTGGPTPVPAFKENRLP